jgi:thiopurine S-methyltransferase
MAFSFRLVDDLCIKLINVQARQLRRHWKPVVLLTPENKKMAHETNSSLGFWEEKYWSKNLSPWHLKDVHKQLIEYEKELFPTKPARVLVPLCGKTVDLRFLYENGYEVVGVEGTELAIQEFFKEQNIEHTRSSYGSGGSMYQSTDKRLTILNTNFFTIEDPEYVGTFDAVWDRAAIVAVEPEHRVFFAAACKRLLKPIFRYLLVVTDYDQSLVQGPPYSVTSVEVDELYKDWAAITKLHTLKHNPNTTEYIAEKFIQANVSLSDVTYLLRNL